MTTFFFSDIPWEHLYQRPQQLASRLGGRWPVLWIEPATLGAPRKWTPQQKMDRLWLLTLPQFPHNAKSPVLRTLSRILSGVPLFRWMLLLLQSCLLQRACRRLHIEPSTTAAVVENFQFAPLIERLRPATVVFDYIDDAFGFVACPAYVRADWTRIIRLADTITVTSGVLRRQIEQAGGSPVHLLENGVDAGAYVALASRPADLQSPGRPIAMYVGTISHWFDFDLLDAALAALPGIDIVLVGPVHPDSRSRLNESTKFTNLHVLGARAHAEVPAYLGAAAAGIIPFVRNRLTEAVNPVKLYEYAAAGLPVVTTAFSDDLERFRNVAFIAGTKEEFVSLLSRALSHGTGVPDGKSLRAFAHANDWDARAATMAGLIEEMERRHSAR
jgi:teichuronic acid biosynthesis glycosyltransferase TuaH